MAGGLLLRATTTTTMRSAGMVRALAQRAQSTQAHTVLTFDGDGTRPLSRPVCDCGTVDLTLC